MSLGLTQEHEYNISTILHGSVLGNTVGVLKAWNVSIPGPLTTNQKSGESKLVPSIFIFFSHLTSEEALLLAVRLRASEA